MANKRRIERNREIVHKRDVLKWTFTKIGQHFNIGRRAAFEVYKREKDKHAQEYAHLTGE